MYESINGSATPTCRSDDLLYSRVTFAGKTARVEQEPFNDKWYNDENLKAVRAQFRLLPLEY